MEMKWEQEGLESNGRGCLSARVSKPGCRGFRTPAPPGRLSSGSPPGSTAREAPPLGGLPATGLRPGGAALPGVHSLSPGALCSSELLSPPNQCAL